MIISNRILRLANGLYTQTDAMRILNIDRYTFELHAKQGLIPKPSTRSKYGNRRYYYTEQQLTAMRKHFKKSPTVASALDYITMREAAKLIGVAYGTIIHNIKSGNLAGPTHLNGKRLYYTTKEIPALKKQWEAKPPPRCNQKWKSVKAEGYCSGVDASKALGMPHVTFTLYQRLSKLPKPTRKAQGLKQEVYNSKDIEAMRAMLKQCGYKRMATSITTT